MKMFSFINLTFVEINFVATDLTVILIMVIFETDVADLQLHNTIITKSRTQKLPITIVLKKKLEIGLASWTDVLLVSRHKIRRGFLARCSKIP